MKHVGPPSSFETGMLDIEEKSFTWTIENFSVIRLHKSWIATQKIKFSAGNKVGHPSKWSVFLRQYTKDGKEWVGILFNIEKPRPSSSSWKNAFAEMGFSMEGPEPLNINTGPLEVASFTNGWGFRQFLPVESTPERLVIKHTFKLYVPLKSTKACLQPTLEAYQLKFATQAMEDFAIQLKNHIPGDDIKLISKDKKEFAVQKAVLAARSPVLEAMLRTDMLEAKSGVIQLPDISSKGLEVLIPFLSTGELHPDWSEPEVVVELTNAAGKYQLQDLLKFLDKTLGQVCKLENVLALFTLAHQLSLKTAEKELSKFIHALSNSTEACCKMLRGISLPGENADGLTVGYSGGRSRLWSRFLRSFRMMFERNERKT